MKNILKIVKPLKSAILLAATVLSLAACDDLVFESEGICEVNYRLRFVYNMNLKWADAFPSEVRSVHLYAFDSRGLFVKDFVANGTAVESEDYRMLLDLEPGKYTLVAWCGMDNEGVTEKSFTVPMPVAGVTRLEELTCLLNTESDSESAIYSDKILQFLYHGIQEVVLPDVHDGDFDYTIYLTKDTNNFRIILQQLSADEMDPNQFHFKIEEANSFMGYDNSMLSQDVVTYRSWDVQPILAGIIPNDGADEEVPAQGVIAYLSTSRLMANHLSSMILTITCDEKEEPIARVPLLQYVMLGREYYENVYGYKITPQEFLDRGDEYVFTFFLDETQRWTEMQINILDWRKVIYNYDFEG